MKIEKDVIRGKWIVWKVEGNLLTELFNSKTKRECNEFIKGVLYAEKD